MLKKLGVALALAVCAGAVMAADAGPSKGSLVIIGGGLRVNNAEVWEKIVALAGGKGARIAVLPTAAQTPAKEAQLTVDALNRYGARAFVVPVAPMLAGTDVRKAADDPALAEAIRKAGGAFFTGGDQARITGSLRRADGSNTAVLDALWALYRRGGVIAGTSAGAAIMSSTMFYDPPLEVMPVLKNGVADGKDVASGLGFIGDDVFVDQHLLARGRFGRMLPAMLAKGYTLGLGIDENTAAVVGPARDVTVIGYRGALVLDLAGATTDKTKPGFNLANARISYLDSGDRFNLATRAYAPGPGKEPVDRQYVEHRAPIFYTDILGNTAVADLLEKLVDSDLQRAVGVAFEGPDSQSPDRGFEFTFTRVPDTAAYVTNREDAYSIYRIRMDVRPVRVHQPFYTLE
ncbi:cyanophycinase [Massilia sp. Root133]|uniref:Cyanophycinase n=1 Tax=Massilia cellulosiltytica TaxID=2683234 RepID=A0A7X3FWC3_9BURK|nr:MULTISPECIES: cyanophycinase [Telluria group]KQY12369.1 cyanophycinase [Massilia sp. Root133]KQZ41076.1 cyanophycinase [Massilia sp. Root1485]MVW59235.1 cyanophycinase [Telluria cellulosilytica]